MGINDFSKLLENYAPNCVRKIPIHKFAGKRVAIDLNNLLYQQYHGAFKASDGENADNMAIIFLQKYFNKLIKNKVTPVCVCDSQADPSKDKILNERRGKRKKAEEMLKTCSDEDKKKLQIKAFHIDDVKLAMFVDEIKKMGITVIHANDVNIRTNDAEGICVTLCLNGYCNAIISTDTDVHVYGGEKQIIKIEKGNFVIRSLRLILQQLDMTFESFRDLCLMIGSDYSKLSGVGVCRGITYIKKHGRVRESDMDKMNYKDALEIFNSALVEYKFECLPQPSKVTSRE